ncbi:glutathione-disulfide reductase [Taylorella equigenitalis]|uniref:Pyridine nucleotide-disulfide oxidoreductase n=1 Tax=Taylorella equigenitalis ATCC 35865 TaxID=743973 RepID=A0ABN4AUA5_9BURK|nr:glutathione-disulfide reductase [Taylorella equigenitalis]AFN35371.1 Pyridine nucleotide-disulfide oxidoreductase [Taylorella equigenitalis ATCC 35865]ASY37336.1 glutathione-disulfide reductase [Taylorella equigenitalis]ASY38802.1 glutathione-disulfide reductase [Taylorella equigenitalis]ASY40326.1 glutathione-disulfide reductase [Taylorella equigenitalis]ASY41759.1 glutathione-disulfide reductase [Taylorella equigenitalis]
MPTFDYDLFVIGAGSGGVRASRMAASMGARVAVAEDAPLGGTCVNLGCVPKKLYKYASDFSGDFEASRGFGWSIEGISFDWEVLKANRAKEISRLNNIYQNILEKPGVQIIRGRASLVDEHTIEVEGKHYTSKNILIATGGWPGIPEIEGGELSVNSNQIFDLEELPKKIVIVGGGFIACEFSSIFNGLGVQVHLIVRSKMLKNFDAPSMDFLKEEMIKHGVDIQEGVNIKSIDLNDEGSEFKLTVHLDNNVSLQADEVLMAVGRIPNTEGLNLDEVGIETSKSGHIKVNENFQTSVPSIFALGDVVGRLELTPVAIAEAMTLVNHMFGDGTRKMSYQNVPFAVFTNPTFGSVGLTESEAQEKFSDDVEIFESNFKAMKHTLSGKDERTLMRIIVQKSTDKVLGVHMVGEDAPEIIQGFAVALRAGATKADFDSTIGIHPTSAEELVTMRTPKSK